MAPEEIPPLPLPLERWNRIAQALKLSPQQKRIVELILRNYCDKQIALAMQLRHPTVRTYLSRIFSRLQVGDRQELVLLVFRMSHGK